MQIEQLECRESCSGLTAANVIIGPNTLFEGTTRAAVTAQLEKMPVDMELSAQDRSMIGPQTVVQVYPQRTALPTCVLKPAAVDAVFSVPDSVTVPGAALDPFVISVLEQK